MLAGKVESQILVISRWEAISSLTQVTPKGLRPSAKYPHLSCIVCSGSRQTGPLRGLPAQHGAAIPLSPRGCPGYGYTTPQQLHQKILPLQMAIQYYHLAVENTNNKEILPGYYSNLANIYTRWGEFSNARTYLFKSLDILENDSVKNYPLIADIYHNISYSF